MKMNYFKTIALAVGVLFCFIPNVLADGMIIIEPPIMPPPVPPVNLSVKYHHVTVDIQNQVAKVHIEQVFKNPNDYQIEGTYMFPMPKDAVVSNFDMWVDGVKLEGEVLDKDEARSIYEETVRRQIDPALLEYVGQGMYKARIFPIEANAEKKVEIEYSQVIVKDANLLRFLYPLNTEKFSSEKLENVTITVSIKGVNALKNIYSPTHKISVHTKGDYEATVSYEENDVLPRRDFELLFAEESKDFGVHIASYRKPDADGFFLLLASPGGDIDLEDIAPKDIVFVIDTSGSMSGDKLEQAKEALQYVLDRLREADMKKSDEPRDRFNIIDFSDVVNSYKGELQFPDAFVVKEAKEYVSKMESAGGTNIHDALLDSLAMLKDQNRNQIVVFLTDGEPTVGETDEGAIVKAVKEANVKNSKVFVFGVGDDVNTHLLDFISGDSKAISTYVSESESIESKVSSFYDKVAYPVLSDLEITFGTDIGVYDMFPAELPDLFKGSQIVLLGRYRTPKSTSVILKGKTHTDSKQYLFEASFVGDNERLDYLPALWASRKVGYLMDQIRLYGDDSKELKETIIALSKKYGIINEYTSFLVDFDAGDDFSDFMDNAAEAFDMSLDSQSFGQSTGAAAQKAVKSVQQLRYSNNLAEQREYVEQGNVGVNYVGTKVFYQQKNVWVDEAYKQGNERDIAFGSDEYFQFVTDYPANAKYLALGQNVNFCDDAGNCYRVFGEDKPIDVGNVLDSSLFLDLPTTHWSYEYVNNLLSNKVISGYSDDTFKPNQNITRAEFLKLVMLAFSVDLSAASASTVRRFDDVSPGVWFYPYVEAAYQMGVVKGMADGKFHPGSYITRAEAVKILLGIAGKDSVSYDSYDFVDATRHWGRDYIQQAYELGVISGYPDGGFGPDNRITRAEAAKVVVMMGENE